MDRLNVSVSATLVERTNCICDMCHGTGMVVSVLIPDTKYRPKGKELLLVNEPIRMWMCENCMDKLLRAIIIPFQEPKRRRAMAEVRPIDANALIEKLRKHEGQFPADGNEPFMCWEVEGYINDQETLTQTMERPGKWEKATGMLPPEFHDKHRCSLCGYFALYEKPFREELSNYCPNCGAKMEVQEDA